MLYNKTDTIIQVLFIVISKNMDVKEVPNENCILTHPVRYIKIPL